MVECFKTLMLCLNRIGCPKDIKGLIKNKIVVRKTKIKIDSKKEWFELFGKKYGMHRKWYKNGQLCREIMFKDGKMNGLYRMWYADGQLWFDCMYKDGKENGLCRMWYPNGQLKYKNMYKDGEEIEFLN